MSEMTDTEQCEEIAYPEVEIYSREYLEHLQRRGEFNLPPGDLTFKDFLNFFMSWLVKRHGKGIHVTGFPSVFSESPESGIFRGAVVQYWPDLKTPE